MTRVICRAVACLVVGLLAWTVAAALAQSAPSQEKEVAARGEGLVLARCAVCHSTDLITQQRLDRGKWDATLAKMRQWGAELTDEEAHLLATYLSTRYSPATPDVLPQVLESPTPFRVEDESQPASDRPSGNVRQGAGLFSLNCQACHGHMAAGGAGPKLAGNPILGEDDRFWDTVLHGRGAMPAWGAVLRSQDIADIHAWLRSLEQ